MVSTNIKRNGIVLITIETTVKMIVKSTVYSKSDNKSMRNDGEWWAVSKQYNGHVQTISGAFPAVFRDAMKRKVEVQTQKKTCPRRKGRFLRGIPII